MNRKVLFLGVLPSIMIWACIFTTQPFSEDTNSTPSTEPLQPFSTSSEDEYTCDVQMVITGVEEIDLQNGSKMVYIRIGIENHGNLWGMLIGPDDSYDTETQKSVFITTQDGSIYGFMNDSYGGIPEELLPEISSSFYITNRGVIISPLIPPGFPYKVNQGLGIYSILGSHFIMDLHFKCPLHKYQRQ